VVFFVQKSQIEKIKTLNETISSYMSIFDIKDVKEFVSMKEETMNMQIEKFKDNYKPSEKQIKEIFEAGYDKFKENVEKQVTVEFSELALFAATVLMTSKNEEREAIKNRFLPRTKEYFDKEFLDYLRKKT